MTPSRHVEPLLSILDQAYEQRFRETFDFPGGKRFHFADPNGNKIAVWSEQ